MTIAYTMRSLYRLSLLVTTTTAAIVPLASCFNSTKSSGPLDAGELPSVLAPDANLADAGTARYSVGGQVVGLQGTGLTLVGDGIEPVTISPPAVSGANVPFTFKTLVPTGFPYTVTIQTQPTKPSQKCTVVAGSGKVGHGNVKTIVVNCSTNKYVVEGTATGIVGAGLVLSDEVDGNQGQPDTLDVDGNGQFAFAVAIPSGGSYDVTVAENPSFPSETCQITSQNSGTVTATDPNITVNCNVNSFNVGGMVVGLTAGQTLVLTDNGSDNLTVDANGAFTFPVPVPSGGVYEATIKTQPSDDLCTISGASGTVGSADFTGIMVNCTPETFTIGGVVNGLQGTGLELNSTAGTLQISANGAFMFPDPLINGSSYDVTVGAPPSNPPQTCTIGGGSGVIDGANVDVTVSCQTTAFTIGAQVSGLPAGTTLTLADNGSDDLTIDVNGRFTFANTVLAGGTYDVTIVSSPPGQTCTPTSNTGVADENISGVVVSCAPTAFTIGGQVSGLAAGQTVTLLDNGSDSLPVGASGGFTFAIPVAPGGMYDVTVVATPPGQVCAPSSNTGIAEANVSTVLVSCQNLYTVTVNVQNNCGAAPVTVADFDHPGATVNEPTASSDVVPLESLLATDTYNLSVKCTPACDCCGSALCNLDAVDGGSVTGDQTMGTGNVTIDAFCCCS